MELNEPRTQGMVVLIRTDLKTKQVIEVVQRWPVDAREMLAYEDWSLESGTVLVGQSPMAHVAAAQKAADTSPFKVMQAEPQPQGVTQPVAIPEEEPLPGEGTD